MPTLSVFRICSDQMLCMGSTMMTRSPIALVAINDWIIGMYSPHLPSPVHCPLMGSQRKTQAQVKAMAQASKKPRVILEASWTNGVMNTRRKKKSMLAFTRVSRTTYITCIPKVNWRMNGTLAFTKDKSVTA